MKRILPLLITLLCFSQPTEAQKPNKVEKFISKYQIFVEEVIATPFEDFHGDTLIRTKRQQRSFMCRYRWYFKKRMSEEQLERYNKLCGRYHRKMNRLANRRRWAATKGRITGRFEGLFKRQDNPTDSLPIPDTLYYDD